MRAPLFMEGMREDEAKAYRIDGAAPPPPAPAPRQGVIATNSRSRYHPSRAFFSIFQKRAIRYHLYAQVPYAILFSSTIVPLRPVGVTGNILALRQRAGRSRHPMLLLPDGPEHL